MENVTYVHSHELMGSLLGKHYEQNMRRYAKEHPFRRYVFLHGLPVKEEFFFTKWGRDRAVEKKYKETYGAVCHCEHVPWRIPEKEDEPNIGEMSWLP